ncbi:hypothetical protein JQ575_29940 [Bradyrhizobium sp. JYMT SZCCT0428]|nr:hypothetical protein [Bradyrhizobium sp. JYMT SZCCT0428]
MYVLRGKSFTASQVAELDDVTAEEKRQFALQAGLSDQRLKEIEALMAAMATPIRDFVEKSMRPGIDRLIKLEQIAADIQQRPTLKYLGIWSAEKSYEPGTFVTHSGSIWYTDVKSVGVRPGEGANVIWKLAVKRGGSK